MVSRETSMDYFLNLSLTFNSDDGGRGDADTSLAERTDACGEAVSQGLVGRGTMFTPQKQ